MKLASGQVAGFLRSPGACRVVLLYGEDAGMIRDRAESLVRAVAGSLDDPFLVAELARDELGRLSDEAASLPLTGGRRVIRVREAGELRLGLGAGGAEKPGAGTGGAGSCGALQPVPSALRRRGAPDAAAIGCYPEEGRELEATIRSTLSALDVTIEPDALSWLTSQLGADRASTRAELEKLALYVGPNGRIDLEAAMGCVGDLAGLSLDDALFAATAGDVAAADRALELAMAEGAAPVQILRAGLAHLQRLHRARLAMEENRLSASDAARNLRPPVFYKKTGAFIRALGLWPTSALIAAMAGLAEAERGCKRTGWPDEVLCRNAVLALARRAAAGRR